MIDIKKCFGKERILNRKIYFVIKNKKVLKYAPLKNSFSSIEPSRMHIPEWFKKTEKFEKNILKNNKIIKTPESPSFKLCTVFTESFTTGYMVTLPVDIVVEQTKMGPSISWRKEINEEIISLRQNDFQNNSLPTPEGFSNLHFAWITKNVIKIPKGYSFLITHPLNRHDLPFVTLSGIIDGEMTLHNGNIPVYFNLKFEGVIPKGTPIMQIIPFKTENWTSKLDSKIINEGILNSELTITKIFGWYKQNIWKKKIYD